MFALAVVFKLTLAAALYLCVRATRELSVPIDRGWVGRLQSSRGERRHLYALAPLVVAMCAMAWAPYVKGNAQFVLGVVWAFVTAAYVTLGFVAARVALSRPGIAFKLQAAYGIGLLGRSTEVMLSSGISSTSATGAWIGAAISAFVLVGVLVLDVMENREAAAIEADEPTKT